MTVDMMRYIPTRELSALQCVHATWRETLCADLRRRHRLTGLAWRLLRLGVEDMIARVLHDPDITVTVAVADGYEGGLIMAWAVTSLDGTLYYCWTRGSARRCGLCSDLLEEVGCTGTAMMTTMGHLVPALRALPRKDLL